MDRTPVNVARQVPNALTTLRLLVVPVFILLFLRGGGAREVAGALFLFASLTDLLDGQLARRMQVTSRFGRIVDPIADRMLVGSAVVLLCAVDGRWFAGADGRLVGVEFLFVLANDLVALVGAVKLRRDHRGLPDVTRIGKLATALSMTGLVGLLLLPTATWPVWPFEAGLLLGLAALAQYARRFRLLEATPD